MREDKEFPRIVDQIASSSDKKFERVAHIPDANLVYRTGATNP